MNLIFIASALISMLLIANISKAAVMQVSSRLLQHSALVTLFTRQNCSLCETAKIVLKDVGKARSFDYHEVDVMSKGQEQWKFAYEFDAPVVCTINVTHASSLNLSCSFTSNEFSIRLQSPTS